MKILLSIAILLFSILLHANELVKVNGEEEKKFQDSAFIKLMNTLNGGEIPYPFSKLLDSFGTGTREEGNVLLVPKGRSLVKEYADNENPRIILDPIGRTFNPISNEQLPERQQAVKKILDMGIREGDLYIGFAPKHNALEVISYNPEKPGFDFFIVENYAPGQTPKVVHNPAQCLGCHQNEAPIFSKFPWHELAGKESDAFIGLIKPSPSMNDVIGRIREANPSRKEIEGIPIDRGERFGIGEVFSFDLKIRRSNDLVSSAKSCDILCDRNSDDCQKTLILESLKNKPNYTKYSFFSNVLKKLDTLKMSSSVIPDRDPISGKGFKQIRTMKDIDGNLSASVNDDANAKIFKEEKAEIIRNNGFRSEYDMTYDERDNDGSVFKQIDSKLLNPIAKRPENSNITQLKYRINNLTDPNKKIHEIVKLCLPVDELKKINDGNSITNEVLNHKNLQVVYKRWPNARDLIPELGKVFLKVEEAEKLENKCALGIKDSLPIYEFDKKIIQAVEKINEEKVVKPQALFGRYCTQCHGGSAAFIPLPLNSLESMAKYKPKFSEINVLERLSKKIMPPQGASQPTEAERKSMINALKELKAK